MTIKQEPYLGFNAIGNIYLAGVEPYKPSTPGPETTEAAHEWSRVDKTNIADLETFVRRHGVSPEADYARARLDGLKQPVTTAAPPPGLAVTPPKSEGIKPSCSTTPCSPENRCIRGHWRRSVRRREIKSHAVAHYRP
jgi:hypothetical protein